MLKETMRTHVVIPRELVVSVDEVVGRRARSRFIADAVAEKLARVRQQTVLRNAAGALADRDVPGWESSAAASEWVRRSRARDDERLARLPEGEGASAGNLPDTDGLIDDSKGREPAVTRIRELLDQGDELGLCAINVAEFLAGIAPADREYWHTVLATLVYWPTSFAAAAQAGAWRKDCALQGRTISVADALIAAVAVERGATLVTRNARDYPMPGLQLLVLVPGTGRWALLGYHAPANRQVQAQEL